MKDPYRQVGLRSGTTELVCYLPDFGLRPGLVVTLDSKEVDRDTWWTIEWVGSHPREKSTIRNTWHNNI